jgi:MraZ protein
MENNPSSRHRPLFLSGEYDALLDEKNRILIPADFRKEITDARAEKELVCRIGRNRVPWLYVESYYREMIARRRQSLMPGEDEEKFNEAYYGMIFRMSWDAQGRIVVPEKIMARSNMGRTLTLVGAGDHIAIWNRDAWETRTTTLLETIDEISDRERRTTTATTTTVTGESAA